VRRGHGGDLVVAAALHRAAQALEDGAGFAHGDGRTEEAVHARRAEADVLARGHARARQDRARHGGAAGQLGEQGGGVGEDVGDGARIDPALEAVAGLGVHGVTARGAAHAARGEVRALQQHARGAGADLAVGSAHHPGQTHRALAVGDHQVVRVELALDAVEGHQNFAFARAAHLDPRAPHALQVEGVHRLAELQQHQVGDVDHVGDGAYAQALQAVAQPIRRRPDGDLGDHGRAVDRAALGVGDVDLGEGVDPLGLCDALRRRGIGEGEAQAEERRCLARQADVAERVGAVGGDADVQDPVVHRGDGLPQRRARLRHP
jgi:hypothetical protein